MNVLMVTDAKRWAYMDMTDISQLTIYNEKTTSEKVYIKLTISNILVKKMKLFLVTLQLKQIIILECDTTCF